MCQLRGFIFETNSDIAKPSPEFLVIEYFHGARELNQVKMIKQYGNRFLK